MNNKHNEYNEYCLGDDESDDDSLVDSMSNTFGDDVIAFGNATCSSIDDETFADSTGVVDASEVDNSEYPEEPIANSTFNDDIAVTDDATYDMETEEVMSEHNMVTVDMRDIDAAEVSKVDEFFTNGCGCTLLDGQQCSSAFSKQHITSIRDQCSSLPRPDLNNILFGHVIATVKTSEDIITVRHKATARVRNTTTFLHEGQKVMLLVLHIHTIPIMNHRFARCSSFYTILEIGNTTSSNHT